MKANSAVDPQLLERIAELRSIGQEAYQAAQEENRRLGIPNVYSIDGVLYYELPSGELSREDPLAGGQPAAEN